MFVQTEPTPNPATLKFLPGQEVMKDGTIFFQDQSSATGSPLAQNLFNIKGVESVFFGVLIMYSLPLNEIGVGLISSLLFIAI